MGDENRVKEVQELELAEEELRQKLFDTDLKKASIFPIQVSNLKTNNWCELSEQRLFKKLLEHKPAGPMKHYHMAMLHSYMNNVYEDEDTDFEDLLTDKDLQELMNRRQHGGVETLNGILVFKPKYKIRPTTEQITAKLKTLYDMEAIESNESIPEMLQCQNDFFLPDGEFGELLAKREEANQRQIGKDGSHLRDTKSEFTPPEKRNEEEQVIQPPAGRSRKRTKAEKSVND